MSYDANECQSLHKMAPIGLLWTVVVNGDQVYSRISSLNEIVHFQVELRKLRLVYQVTAGMAL